MTVTEPITRPDTAERARFVDETTRDAAHGFASLRSTGTLPDGAAVGALERIPREDTALALVDGGLGLRRRGLQVSERALAPPDGVTAGGAPAGGAAGAPGSDGPDDTVGLEPLLARHPELTTVVVLRSPNLVAWAQSGRVLPIRYVPVQRWTLGRQIPVRTDPTVSLAAFVEQALAADPHTPAVLDAGGGAVVWGTKGLLRTLEYAQLVEEGAQFQLLAERLGGSLPVGPGVLLQQWRMTGLEAAARAEGLLDD
jgi:hypothetical protein